MAFRTETRGHGGGWYRRWFKISLFPPTENLTLGLFVFIYLFFPIPSLRRGTILGRRVQVKNLGSKYIGTRFDLLCLEGLVLLSEGQAIRFEYSTRNALFCRRVFVMAACVRHDASSSLKRNRVRHIVVLAIRRLPA